MGNDERWVMNDEEGTLTPALSRRERGKEVVMQTYGLYLNGRFVTSPETVSVVNPANGEVVGKVSTVGREGVRQALADAQAAFGAWRELPAKVRGDYLLAVAAEVERRKEEIARTIT